jgi:hypothetical protein
VSDSGCKEGRFSQKANVVDGDVEKQWMLFVWVKLDVVQKASDCNVSVV